MEDAFSPFRFRLGCGRLDHSVVSGIHRHRCNMLAVDTRRRWLCGGRRDSIPNTSAISDSLITGAPSARVDWRTASAADARLIRSEASHPGAGRAVQDFDRAAPRRHRATRPHVCTGPPNPGRRKVQIDFARCRETNPVQTRVDDLAGQAGLTGHLRIGEKARIGAQAGVMADVAAGADVLGSPAMPGAGLLPSGRRNSATCGIRTERSAGGGHGFGLSADGRHDTRKHETIEDCDERTGTTGADAREGIRRRYPADHAGNSASLSLS